MEKKPQTDLADDPDYLALKKLLAGIRPERREMFGQILEDMAQQETNNPLFVEK